MQPQRQCVWPYSGEYPRAVERFARTQYARDADSDDRIIFVLPRQLSACPLAAFSNVAVSASGGNGTHGNQPITKLSGQGQRFGIGSRKINRDGIVDVNISAFAVEETDPTVTPAFMVFNRFSAQQFSTHVDSMPECIQADGRHAHGAPGSVASPEAENGPAGCELVYGGRSSGQ